MGGCLSNWNNNNISSSRSSKKDITVTVITEKGDLRQYTVPVTVSQVIHSETTQSSSNNNEWFLCNSDSLYYDEYIQPLDFEEELEGGAVDHIYFMLPTTRLQYPLTASDMAALAVKATLALQHTTTTTLQKQPHKQHNNVSSNKARISPFHLADDEQQNQLTLKKLVADQNVLRKQKSLISNSSPNYPSGIPKSMRQLHRYSSTRAKMAVRSFKLRLTTIYEGSTHF